MKPGNVTINANVIGASAFYNDADEVSQTFCVNPLKPEIDVSESGSGLPILNSTSTLGNVWYLDGNIIPGESGDAITVSESGLYTVQVTIDGCKSEMSGELNLIVTSLEESQENYITLFPNPATDLVTINSKGQCSIDVMDFTGRVLSTYEMKQDYSIQHSIADYPEGVYLIRIVTHAYSFVRKFLKK